MPGQEHSKFFAAEGADEAVVGGDDRVGELAPCGLLEHGLEAGLFEVVVGSEGFGDAPLGHDDERDAVAQRPSLVWALCV